MMKNPITHSPATDTEILPFLPASQNEASPVDVAGTELELNELESKLEAGRRLRSQALVSHTPSSASHTAPQPLQMTARVCALSAEETAAWETRQAHRVNPSTGMGCRVPLAAVGTGVGCLGCLTVAGAWSVAACTGAPLAGAIMLSSAPSLFCFAIGIPAANGLNSLTAPDRSLFACREGGAAYADIFDLLTFVRDELHPLDLPDHVRLLWSAARDLKDVYGDKHRSHPERWQANVWQIVGSKLITSLRDAGCVALAPRGTFTLESSKGLASHLATFGAAFNLSDESMAKVYDVLLTTRLARQHFESKHTRAEMSDVLQAIESQAASVPAGSLLAEPRCDAIDEAASLIAHAIGEIDGALPARDTDEPYRGSPERNTKLQQLRAMRKNWSEAQVKLDDKQAALCVPMAHANRTETYIERFLRQSPEYMALKADRDRAKGAFEKLKSHLDDRFVTPARKRLEQISALGC